MRRNKFTCILIGVVCLLALAACSHEHEWIAANCTTAKICFTCGETEGEPAGHRWIDATCTTPKTCSVCATMEGEALEHTVAEWTIKKAATCREKGLSVGTCSACEESLEKTIEIAEHPAGEWIITKAATLTEKGTRYRECTICGKKLENEEFELSGEEREKAYKKACETYSFTQIARSPNEYEGKLAKFTGEVIQVQQQTFLGKTEYVLRVNITKKGSSSYKYYTDTIYVTYTADSGAPKILEDDIVTMYGELRGEKTYTSVLGSSITIPSFDAEYITIK